MGTASGTPAEQAAAVTDVLSQYKIAGIAEAGVQSQIEKALRSQGVSFAREVQLGTHDRIDFLVGEVGIEVKTRGERAAIIRQLARYAKSDRVGALVLASTSRRMLHSIPDEILETPIVKHLLQGSQL